MHMRAIPGALSCALLALAGSARVSPAGMSPTDGGIRITKYREFHEQEHAPTRKGLWLFCAKYYSYDKEAKGCMLLPVSEQKVLRQTQVTIEVVPARSVGISGRPDDAARGGEASLRAEISSPESHGPIFAIDLDRLKAGKYEVVARIRTGGGQPSEFGRDEFEKAAGLPGEKARRARVPILLDAAFPTGGELVLSTGVPLPEGALYDARNVRVVDALGREVPSQAEPFLKWSENGSLKWIRLHFVAEADGPSKIVDRLRSKRSHEEAPYYVEFGTEVRREAPREAVSVDETAEAVVVDTGRIRVEVPKRGGLVGAIHFDVDGDGTYRTSERMTSGPVFNSLVPKQARRLVST